MKNKIKGISFQPEFISLIKQGKKTVTRRVETNLKRGDICYFKAGRTGKKEGYIRIIGYVRYENLFSIFTDYGLHELEKEGFYTGSWLDQAIDFKNLWNKLNEDSKYKYEQDPFVYRIEFKYLGDDENEFKI